VLDHLPFFSACKGFDNELVIFKLLEGLDNCTLFDSSNGSYISQWSPFGVSADKLMSSTDKCQWNNIPCMYEEPVDKNAGQSTYWFKLSPEDVMFYLTKDAYSSEDYLGLYDSEPGTSDKPNQAVQDAQSFFNFDQMKVDDTITPVLIQGPDEDYGDLAVTGIPRDMELEIRFYQISPTKKRIVKAFLKFKSYDVMTGQPEDPLYAGTIDPRYNLTVTYQAYVWFELLNIFAFDPLLYLVLSSLFGFVLLIICFLMWATVRITTPLNDPPVFSIAKSFHLITLNVAKGCLIGVAPVVAIGASVLFSYKAILEKIIVNTGFDGLANNFLVMADIELVKGGRFCVCLVFCGFYILWHAIDGLLVEKDIVNVDETNQESESLPEHVDLREFDSDVEHSRKQLRKTHVVAVYIVVMIYHAIFWEFSYSATFGNFVFVITAFMVVWNVFIEHHFGNWLQDEMFLNIAVLSNIMVESITGLGCNNFMDYIVNLALGFSIMSFQRTYLDIWIDLFIDRWDWLILVVQKIYRVLSPSYDEDGNLVVEEFDLDAEEFQIEDAPVIESICGNFGGYTCDALNLFIMPIIVLTVWVVEDYTKIGANYGIKKRDFIYYLFFNLSALVTGVLIDLHLLSMLELIYGWKIQEYLVYTKHRFSTRLCRWRMHDACNDQSLEPASQNLDVLGFSSQYYFIICINGLSIFLIDLGVQGMFRNQYNPFNDQVVIAMLLFSIIVCNVVHTLSLKIGTLFLWHLPSGAPVGDDGFMHEISNDFFLPSFQEGGEHGQRAVGGARMSSYGDDKNSEAFKLAFLEDNKPWILQRLGIGREIPSAVANLEKALAESKYPNQFDDGDFMRAGVVVSSDDGSSDESDDIKNVTVALDPVSKKVLRLWLAYTRRRMGLPEKAPRADLSSDEETDSDVQPVFGTSSVSKLRFSASARAIGKLWLAQLPHRTSAVKSVLDLSDDSSEPELGAKPAAGLQMSAKSREIGRLWLSMITRDSADNRRQRPISAATISESSSDTQTSEYGLTTQMLPDQPARALDPGSRLQPRAAFVSETSSSEHAIPNRQQPQRRPNIAQNLSSSSEEQDVSSSDQDQMPPIPGAMPAATLRIATIWLSKLRR
jgi:hypothetical protein